MKRYIEVSTAFVYKSQAKSPATESADLDPWTLQARFKLEAENEIRKLGNLNVVFVRPVTVRPLPLSEWLYDAEMSLACVGLWIRRLVWLDASHRLRRFVCSLRRKSCTFSRF